MFHRFLNVMVMLLLLLLLLVHMVLLLLLVVVMPKLHARAIRPHLLSPRAVQAVLLTTRTED